MVRTPTDRTLPAVAALFLASGASGLVFEVVWVRQLGLWVGHSTVAVSLVVAAFLTGLVPGAWLLGRAADRHPRPLRLYAALEALAGVSALAVTLVLSRAGTLAGVPWVPAGLGPRLALAFAVLLLPTFAMGATLPVLTRFVARDLRSARDGTDSGRVGRSFGTLYAVNTLGAVLGCAVAGFVAIGRIGLVRTALAAAALDLAIALIAALWDATLPALLPGTYSAGATPGDSRDARRVRDGRVATALAAATGFAAIGCEVLWFRVLATFLKASTYAFTLLLATYLLGLVLGGMFYARRLAAHPRPWSVLAECQLLVAFAGLLSVAVLGRAPSLVGLIHGALGRSTQSDADLSQVVLAAAVVLLPAAVLGAAYPALAALGAHDPRRVGGGIGDVAAANTLGGAFGSLFTGLVLLPALGTQRSFGVVLAISLGVALVARSRCALDDSARARVPRLAVLFALAWLLLPGDLLLRAIAHHPRARVLAVREGRDGTVAALGYDRATVCRASPHHCAHHCQRDFSYQQLVFGAISYASTILPARRYMRALAHLPMLLHPAPSRVLQICFGTGTTAAAFTAYDSLQSLTVVDLNPDVFALAPYFAESNHGVLRDPRAHTVADDGRHYLATLGRDHSRTQRSLEAPEVGTIDVISLEPPPPTADGAASLYTREFYRLAHQRLAPGGILAQWVPLDQQPEGLDRSLLAAVTREFHYVELWIPARLEGVVLASDRPLTVDLSQWRSRWQAPSVAESLRGVGFPTAESLLATRVLDTAAVRRWVGDASAVTDDLPSAAYYRAWPGPPLDVPAMLTRAVDPPEGPSDEAGTAGRVRALAAAERLQMLAHARLLVGDSEGAGALAREAAARSGAVQGATPYTDYLTALEYDCLDLDAP